MNRLICFLTLLISVPVAATPSGAATTRLHYRLKPGQQWLCTRLSRMEFTVMGRKQVQTSKDTIVYKVSSGPRKGWVRLSARYVDPPPKDEENAIAQAKYELVFSAQMHTSGQVRGVEVQGIETPSADPAFDEAMQASYIQSKRLMADAHKAAVFWFPELPEEPIAVGDEFDDRRNDRMEAEMIQSRTQTRRSFTLEDVASGLAYFGVRERSVNRNQTMGAVVETKSAGKGDAVFDLDHGMWVEITTRRRMNVSGGMLAGGQDMSMSEKIEIRLK